MHYLTTHTPPQGLPEEFIERAAEEAGVDLLICRCGDRRCRKYL